MIRIGEYVKLLTWFELHTPRTHADRQDLDNAIATLTELDRGIREVNDVPHASMIGWVEMWIGVLRACLSEWVGDFDCVCVVLDRDSSS